MLMPDNEGAPMQSLLQKHFTHLLHLKTVIECGSINRAATMLHVTQPSLTRSIGRLEDVLGVALLNRTSKGVTPTNVGSILLSHIDAANSALQRGDDEITALKGANTGTIVCGAGQIATGFLMPHAINQFRNSNPRLHIRLLEDHTPRLLNKLKQGELDLVIGSRIEDEDDAGLAIETLVKEHIDVYARNKHPVFKSAPCRLEDLLGSEKWILPGPNVHMHRSVTAEFRRRSLQRPAAFVETSSLQATRWLVREGRYLAVSTSLIFAADITEGLVRAVSGDWRFPPARTVLYRRKGEPVRANVLAFIKVLKQTVRLWSDTAVRA
jgi:LysR family transcriptional regulator, pca operon transcriptional activator